MCRYLPRSRSPYRSAVVRRSLDDTLQDLRRRLDFASIDDEAPMSPLMTGAAPATAAALARSTSPVK